MMSWFGEERKVPQPQLDEDGNQIVIEEGSELGTSKRPTLEDLMKKLEKLKAENKNLNTKGRKGKAYSSSSEDGNSSFEEEISNKGRKKHDKPSYNSMSF
jgi:predicted RNase H-like nuclease (RuvC/YqgF family)